MTSAYGKKSTFKSKEIPCTEKTGGYIPLLDPMETELGVRLVKETFISSLEKKLNLVKVTAPLAVREGEGVNDDLGGYERPVTFTVKQTGTKASIVQSLAKWKRLRLGSLRMKPGNGLWTNMKALRPDDILSPIHSVLVDQWDWEKCITKEQRNPEFLKSQVECIYEALKDTESAVCSEYPQIRPILPPTIKFIRSGELLDMYPGLSSKEREDAITSKYGAVFIAGIGEKLNNGEPHDVRAPDYDDWSTPCKEGFNGLNGDIIVHNPVTKSAFEISSMGIRVDPHALMKQLRDTGCTERLELDYHRMLMEERLPDCIGGGIGQSRICMLMLRKAHIGEVQAGVWPPSVIRECREQGIELI